MTNSIRVARPRMRQRNRSWLAGTAIVVLLASQSASASYPERTGLAAVDRRIVTSDNALGLDLFKTLSRGNSRNIAISPLSIALALQIAYNGAVAMTRQSMAQTLHLGSLTTPQLNIAFCSSRAADFSGIGPGYCLSDVEHKSVVKVDETGTVAAAATSTDFHATLARALQFTMTMDHPFFYAIRDDMTKQLLFIGALENPN